MKKTLILSLISLLVFGMTTFAFAETVFEAVDPEGDDYGAGAYDYPTDKVFTKGSFDITKFKVEVEGDNAIFTVDIKGRISNPWNMPAGFSLQGVDIYIDMDHVKDSGITETLGGRYFNIAPESAWEKAIVIGGEPKKYSKEIETKSKNLVGKVIVAETVNVKNKSLSVTIPISVLGGKPDEKWGYVVAMCGYEGIAEKDTVLVRQVLASKNQWRFGGGSDKTDDPNVMDLLIPEGTDFTQEDVLKWEEGKVPVVPAVYKK